MMCESCWHTYCLKHKPHFRMTLLVIVFFIAGVQASRNAYDPIIIPKHNPSVLVAGYHLPQGPFKAYPHTNGWVAMERFPTHNIDFFLYCPFEVSCRGATPMRSVEKSECRAVSQLRQFYPRLDQEIVLDTFKVDGNRLNQDLTDSIYIMEAKGAKTVVVVTLFDTTCLKITYTVLIDGKVHKKVEDDVRCIMVPVNMKKKMFYSWSPDSGL